MSYLFSFSRYQTYLSDLFRQLMTFKLLRFIFDQTLKQWMTGGKREEDGNTKIWISPERKELFRWSQKHLPWFLKGHYLVRNKNWIKNSENWFCKEFGHKTCLMFTFTVFVLQNCTLKSFDYLEIVEGYYVIIPFVE